MVEKAELSSAQLGPLEWGLARAKFQVSLKTPSEWLDSLADCQVDHHSRGARSPCQACSFPRSSSKILLFKSRR